MMTSDVDLVAALLSCRPDIDDDVFHQATQPTAEMLTWGNGNTPSRHPTTSGFAAPTATEVFVRDLLRQRRDAPINVVDAFDVTSGHRTRTADQRSYSHGDARLRETSRMWWSVEPGNSGDEDERMTSSPPTARRQQSQQQQQNVSARYKTELCRTYAENGTCRYGSKCQFAHGRDELRTVSRHPKYKTDKCRTFHTTGLCPYGPRCHFIHNEDDELEREKEHQTTQLEQKQQRQLLTQSQSVDPDLLSWYLQKQAMSGDVTEQRNEQQQQQQYYNAALASLLLQQQQLQHNPVERHPSGSNFAIPPMCNPAASSYPQTPVSTLLLQSDLFHCQNSTLPIGSGGGRHSLGSSSPASSLTGSRSPSPVLPSAIQTPPGLSSLHTQQHPLLHSLSHPAESWTQPEATRVHAKPEDVDQPATRLVSLMAQIKLSEVAELIELVRAMRPSTTEFPSTPAWTSSQVNGMPLQVGASQVYW